MDYLTNYYKNLCDQLQEQVNNLEYLILEYRKTQTQRVEVDDLEWDGNPVPLIHGTVVTKSLPASLDTDFKVSFGQKICLKLHSSPQSLTIKVSHTGVAEFHTELQIPVPRLALCEHVSHVPYQLLSRASSFGAIWLRHNTVCTSWHNQPT